MKSLGLFAAALVFAAAFSVQSFGQAAQPGAAKIAIIDSGAFAAEKEGITKYVNAMKSLNVEFKPKMDELVTIQTKLKQLADDVQKMTSNPAVPVKEADLQAKRDEYDRLTREYDFKKKDVDATADRRSKAVLGPIEQDIGRSIQDWALSKGYSVVLDLDKIGPAVLALDPKADITKEFIAYYNTKPATAATATAPR